MEDHCHVSVVLTIEDKAMSEAMWLTALRRLQAAESGSTARFAQLATLTSEGRPSVRTVVVREVLGDGGIQMTTDSRSAKVAGLRRCGWGELCWYFYVRVPTATIARLANEVIGITRATAHHGGCAYNRWRRCTASKAMGRAFRRDARLVLQPRSRQCGGRPRRGGG